MALPKKLITYPIHDLEIPSNKIKIKFRPFTGKEEKLLLLAKTESENVEKVLNTVLQIIQNCIISPENLDINKLPLFDIEYIFLQLRAKSIDNVVDLSYDNTANIDSALCTRNCPSYIKLKIDLNDVKIQIDSKINDKIVLYDDPEIGMLGIKFKFPEASVLIKIAKLENFDEISQMEELILNSIEYFYDKDKTYIIDSTNPEEIEQTKEMISGFTSHQLKKIEEFFLNIPSLKHSVPVECPECHRKETMTLSGLQDFFL